MKNIQNILKRYHNITFQERSNSFEKNKSKKKNSGYLMKDSKNQNIYVKNIITSPKVVNIHNTTIKVQNPIKGDTILPNKKNKISDNKSKLKWFQQLQRRFPQTDKYNSKKRFIFQTNKPTANVSKIQKSLSKEKSKISEERLINFQQNYRLNHNIDKFLSNNYKHRNYNSHYKSLIKERKTKTIDYDKEGRSPKHKRYKTIQNGVELQSSTKILAQTIERQLQTIDIDFSPEQLNWEQISLPLKPREVLEKYQKYLTSYEKQQISQYQQIYFIGHKAHKIQPKFNADKSFDNKLDEYKYVIGDHIAFRYQILDTIGAGAFGQVIRVFDHKKKIVAALKIIKNKQNFYKQALVELKILKFIKEKDVKNQTNIVKIKDYVMFRNHVCLTFELLDISLYQFMKKNKFQGFTFELIRKFSVQILQALLFLETHKIVHCDLKPQNIVLKQQGKSGIKLIDFGTSCFQNQKIYTYIQSRFYRAPEIVLGIAYNTKIDMWSLGCIIAELYTGYPLFPGESEEQHMNLIIDAIGLPTAQFLSTSNRFKVFFTQEFELKPSMLKAKKHKSDNPRRLREILETDDEQFIDFIERCLLWDPSIRMSPREALTHNFIVQGLPADIKAEHIKQMSLKNPYGLIST